jgi:hypothetical protein
MEPLDAKMMMIKIGVVVVVVPVLPLEANCSGNY